MMKQIIFNYNLEPQLSMDDFFVSSSNIEAYNLLLKPNKLNNNILLIGPKKSGKTHLGSIWYKKFNAIKYDNNNINFSLINNNIFIDDFTKNLNEENLFHLIDHCQLNSLNILLTSSYHLNEYNFKLIDLLSRLKTFLKVKINLPDDELLTNLMVKLFHDKQIIIKNPEIFQYILNRSLRSYEKIFLLIENIDNLSLEKKRELTIPLIKELI